MSHLLKDIVSESFLNFRQPLFIEFETFNQKQTIGHKMIQRDLELFSHRHTKITIIYRQPSMKKTPNLPEKIFYNEKYKEGIIMRQQEVLSSDKVKSHTPRWVIHKQNNYNCRDSPKGLRGLSPTLGSTAQRPSTGETIPPWRIWL